MAASQLIATATATTQEVEIRNSLVIEVESTSDGYRFQGRSCGKKQLLCELPTRGGGRSDPNP